MSRSLAPIDIVRQREAALREVLDLISRSRGDPGPVFDAIVHRAAQLCGAKAAALVMAQSGDNHQRMLAHYGVDPATVAIYDRGEVSMNPDISITARAILTGKTIHIEDMMDTDGYRQGVGHFLSVVNDSGVRTNMFVPLLAPAGGIGCIIVFRKVVQPYTDDEIALVETFAAQAVIAIENVRQFRELQSSLEQQEATSDILRVISQSREDDTQVFDLILEKAAVLCNADQSSLQIVNEARTHVRHMADWGHDRTAYDLGIEYSLDLPLSIVPTIRTAKVVHIEDYSQSVAYKDRDPIAVGLVETEGVRTRLNVPLLQNSIAIGCISLSRRAVRPFTPDEIALVETFAAQAVIAIENVRQFRAIQTANDALQTRLAREAATREILEVISQSRDDDRPVFDTVLRKAAELCGAPLAGLNIINEDRSQAVMVAHWGDSLRALEPGKTRWFLDSDLVPAIAMREGRVVQEHDLADTDAYRSGEPTRRMAVDEEGIRTIVVVPLFSGGHTIGSIALYRREVLPFTADQIVLVETFAAQAVIAIENVRQFRELQTRLAREAATREILEVISQSRDDDAPVFDAVLRNANRLCDTSMAYLVLGRPDDTHMTLAAYVNPYLPSEDGVDQIIAFANQTGMRMDAAEHFSAKAIILGEVVQIADIAASHGYLSGEPTVRILVEDVGVRTVLSVPLFDAQGAIGAISLQRREERPFSDDEISLIQSFAAQAVIAIENVRQFRELQTRLAREAATREILEVISQSRDDDKPVFDVVLRKAAELCNASMASLLLISEDRSHAMLVADWGLGQVSGLIQVGTTVWPMESDYVPSTCMRDGRIAHIYDIADTDLYRSGDPLRVSAVDDDGIRTILAVPLFSGGQTAGCILVYRREVRPFTADEIALVETFAAQAVIAIENVRQFRELQTRLEREAATRDILEVISQSRDDDTPVFDMIAHSAARLCGAAICTFWRVEDSLINYCASYGLDSAASASAHSASGTPLLENTLTGQVFKRRAVARIEDASDESYYDHEWARALGLKQLVGVPIFVGGDVWGSINLMWPLDRAPQEADIQLVESFAAQASIAIENVRQFRELQTRLAREAATSEVLGIISQSRDDDQPVFDVLVKNAQVLCDAPMCALILATPGDKAQRLAAHRNVSSKLVDLYQSGKMVLDGNQSYVAKSILDGCVINLADMAQSDYYKAGSPMVRATVDEIGMRSILFVPLMTGNGAIGVFALFRDHVFPFEQRLVELVETFAAQAVIAIENVRQFKALEALNAELGERVQAQVGEIERMGRLKRFLPAAVADTVISSGSEKMLSSHRALLGVLFCDIRGFTAFCETAEPEETIEVLQTYHEEMGRLIEAHGAGVDHRMGDGIMVLFNDPLPCDDPAGQAVRLGIAMRDRMADLCKGWKKLGHRLGFGVGVSLGYATVGMVGSGGRIDYTASGTAINLASRLSDEAQDGEILLSPRARLAVEDDFAVEPRGEITLKGMREPVEVYRVEGVKP